MPTQKLGGYTLQRRIGKGGMGSVYLAYDPRLKRQVALKVLPPQLAADPDYLARFEREATTLAQIRHPNLMHIYAVGHDKGRHFIVMEYIRGRNLAQILHRDGPLTFPEATRILGQVLSALDKVHAAGVVHRDIKPANVILDEDQRAILMDFGLAKPRDDHSVTTGNIIIGTPEYMAPEVAEGHDAEFPSEIYALGILLFEMLAGSAPFQGSSAVATLRQHIERPVPRIRRFRPDLPEDLQLVLAKALAKKPEDRYPSVRELAADLLPLAQTSELTALSAHARTTATLPMAAVQSAAAAAAPTLTAPMVSQADDAAGRPRARRRAGVFAAAAGAAIALGALAALLWPSGTTHTRATTTSTAVSGRPATPTAAKAATPAPPPVKLTTATATPPTGAGRRYVFVLAGRFPPRAKVIRGRLVAIEGEGGTVRIETDGGKTETVRYESIRCIRPEGER